MSTFILQSGDGTWIDFEASGAGEKGATPSVESARTLAASTSCLKYWRTSGTPVVPGWWEGAFRGAPSVPDPFTLFMPATGLYLRFTASEKEGNLLTTQSSIRPSVTKDAGQAALFIFPAQWSALVPDAFPEFRAALAAMDPMTPILVQSVSGSFGISAVPFVLAHHIRLVTSVDAGSGTASSAVFPLAVVAQMGFGCEGCSQPTECSCADVTSTGMGRDASVPWYTPCKGGLVFGGWGEPQFSVDMTDAAIQVALHKLEGKKHPGMGVHETFKMTGLGPPSLATAANTFRLFAADINCILPPTAAIEGGTSALNSVDATFDKYRRMVVYGASAICAAMLIYVVYAHARHVQPRLDVMASHAAALAPAPAPAPAPQPQPQP